MKSKEEGYMKVSVQKSNQCEKTITVKVAQDRIQQEYDRFFSSVEQNAKIPGFRQGKAPRDVVRSHFQKEAREKVMENLISESYKEALRENEVHPVGYPRIEGVEFNDQELSFKAIVETKPEIKLPRYTGLKLTRSLQTVTDAEINEVIENLKTSHAQFVAVEDRAVQAGDMVIQDIACTVEGKEVDKRQDQWIEVGGQGVITEFSNQLLGLKRDEEKSFSFKLPEQFHMAEHRGKDAQFQIRVKEIKIKKLPELDGEFLKTVGDFATVEDLKKAIRADLEETRKKESDSRLEHELVEELTDKCRFDLPVSLLDNRIYALMDQELKKLSHNGSLVPELEKKKKELHDQLKPEAEKQLRAAFLLQEIARKENIQVTREDVDARFEKMAQMYQQDVNRIKEIYKKNEDELDRLLSELLTIKVISFLKEKSEIKEKTMNEKLKLQSLK